MDAVIKIFQSKNPKAHLIGAIAALLFFAPTVFRVMGDDRLNTWQRLEQISVAIFQTFVGVAIAALPPESVGDKKEE